jgi:hypothetical protein
VGLPPPLQETSDIAIRKIEQARIGLFACLAIFLNLQ